MYYNPDTGFWNATKPRKPGKPEPMVEAEPLRKWLGPVDVYGLAQRVADRTGRALEAERSFLRNLAHRKRIHLYRADEVLTVTGGHLALLYPHLYEGSETDDE